MTRVPGRVLAGLACAAAVASACSDASVALPPASPSPASPSSVAAAPSPTPTVAPPAPVNGGIEYTTVPLGATGMLVYSPGSAGDRPAAVDVTAVRAFVGAVDRWLDAHLTAVQAGAVPDLGLDVAASPAAAAAVTTDLTDPDRPVATASYRAEIGVDGVPAWAHVTITVERRDGTTATADVVLAPGADGPVLLAAGPAGEATP